MPEPLCGSGREAASASRSSKEERMSLSVVLLACLLQSAPPQSSPPSTPTPGSERPTPAANGQDGDAASALPVSLPRIQRALAKPPAIRLIEVQSRNGRPLYRVDIEATKVDVQALLGRDSLRGPVPYGGMTHQEFLDLVTPDDVRGYAAFSNGEGMMVAATSIALQWAVLKAIDKLKSAADERAQAQARAEVEEALEALRKARRAAGLPDK
jgi:hypothetical protein